MPRSRRISIRLPAVQMDRVHEACQGTGRDVSHVVRQALDAFLTPKLASLPNNAPPRRLSPPEGIIPLTAAYRAWGNGDARVELKRLFAATLAASFALRELYPRTPGIREVFEALLPLVGISEWTSV